MLEKFHRSESGAVTVDWVVLTAAIVGFAAASYTLIETNANTLINAAATAVASENDF